MSKKKAKSTQLCDHCAKQLEYRKCKACVGKGYYRKLVFFKNDCDLCSGSGKVLRCPDEAQHNSKVRLKNSPKFNTNFTLKDFQKNGSPKPLRPQDVPPSYRPGNFLNPNSQNNPNNPNNPINKLKQQKKFWR